MGEFLVFCNKIGDFAKNFWQFFVLYGHEFGKHEIDVAELLAEWLVAGAEAKAREILGSKVLDRGFEAIVAASAAPLAEADLAEREVEIVANDQNILRSKFVEIHNSANTDANVVIERLWLYE